MQLDEFSMTVTILHDTTDSRHSMALSLLEQTHIQNILTNTWFSYPVVEKDAEVIISLSKPTKVF